ncbi:MAG: hypothetical protein MJ252_11930 [archaeon]|nr:hypothetical protein [archaeon]
MAKSYFLTKAQNAGEQNVYFVALASWVLGLCGGKLSGDKKYDDPVTMATNLISEMKSVGIDCQVAPTLLKNGYGNPVCTVLLQLVNKALEVKGFSFKPAKLADTKKTKKGGTPEIEDEAPDLINTEIDYGDNLDDEKKEAKANQAEANKEEEDTGTGILYSGISSEEWQRELEKLASKLKLDYDNLNAYGTSEWRGHIETIQNNQKCFVKEIPETRAVLENLSTVVDRSLEKITKMESNLSKNHSNIITSYKDKHKTSSNQYDEYKKLNENVDNLKREIDEITDKIGTANEKYERMSNQVSDTSALGNMKQAINTLQSESLTMDMKINILNHSYLKYMHDTDNYKNAGNEALSESGMYEEVF